MSRRKTARELALAGTYRADRHGGTRPTFTPGARCPAYLSKAAKSEWRRLAPELEANGLLTEASSAIFASYCSAFAFWKESQQQIAADGLVIRIQSTTRTGQTIRPVPNPAIKNLHTFARLMLEAASRLGIDPLAAMKIETPLAPPAPKDNDPLAAIAPSWKQFVD